MSLNKLQVEFTERQARFQVWCFVNGYEIIEKESYRTKEQAQIYFEAGTGILTSSHTKSLARDILRYLNGTISWNIEDYREMGKKWKSMHELARWGGDFKPGKGKVGRDPYHFSFLYRGVQ